MSHAFDKTSSSPTARAFVEARRAGRFLSPYPGPLPVTLADAYEIQDEAISAWPDRIAGWKLGRIKEPLDQQYGAGRLAGPIFSRNIWQAGAEATRFPVIDGGFAAVEAEYIILLGATAPDRADWTAASVVSLIEQVFTGVEIAGSPFPGINESGPAVTASDFGNNAGLILGDEITGWRDRLADLICTVAIDGQIVGRGGAVDIPGGPLDSLAFLLNLLHARGRRLEAGQLISTGAATGVHQIYIGQSAVADFGPDGRIACEAVAATATA